MLLLYDKFYQICEDDVATPAELAKTYMGSRQSKISPSVQSFRSQTSREVVPFVSQTPIVSLAKRPGLFGVTENGFTTPKSRGRSAVYNMARTPYSRVRPTDFQKVGPFYFYAGNCSRTSLDLAFTLSFLPCRVAAPLVIYMLVLHHLILSWSLMKCLDLNKL